MASLLPEELSELGKWMSEERAKKFLSEYDESSIELASRIKNVKVIRYLDEIEKTQAPPLKELADAWGNRGAVARFLSYADNHEYLENYSEPASLHTNNGAVLHKSDIESLCRESLPLIDPLYENGLEPASYQLRLGCRIWVDKEPGWLTDAKPELVIPSHGIAIVSTYEWLNMPRFLIARWNLKVKKVYNGLVWVGGPQVDPGYQGFLFCPLYNLSNVKQVLKYKDPLFIIDFVRTTPFVKGKDKIWPMPMTERRSTFDFSRRLPQGKIESAPQELQKQVIECQDEIGNFKKEISDFKGQTRSNEFLAGVVLTIIVAALAIIVTFGSVEEKWTSNTRLMVLASVAVVISIAALIVSLVFRKRRE